VGARDGRFVIGSLGAEIGVPFLANDGGAKVCVSEGLDALPDNRSRIVPGWMNRVMNAWVPASVKRTFTAKMLGTSLANKPASAKVGAG
jgi:hypothetical protein